MKSKFQQFEMYKGMFGCYAFWRAEVCIYIGKSTDIYRRILGHKSRFSDYERFTAYDFGKHAKGMDHLNARVFLSLMEAYLITIHDPIENVSRPNFFDKMIRVPEHAYPAFRKVKEITNCFPNLTLD